MKCIVPNCENTSRGGHGIKLSVGVLNHEEWICAPCFAFLTKGNKAGTNNQLAQNALQQLPDRKISI